MTVKQLDQALFDDITRAAGESPRRRANHNIHASADEAVQRLFITLMPDSYVRPHRHTEPGKFEFFLMVDGEVDFLIFDDESVLLARHRLSAGSGTRGLDIPPGTWHSVQAVDNPAVFLEVKPGPYTPTPETDFATWSPQEGESDVQAFMQTLRHLKPGQRADDV